MIARTRLYVTLYVYYPLFIFCASLIVDTSSELIKRRNPVQVLTLLRNEYREENNGFKSLCKNKTWKEGDHWGDLGVDGWIILGWISRRWDVGIWTGLGWPRIETSGERL